MAIFKESCYHWYDVRSDTSWQFPVPHNLYTSAKHIEPNVTSSANPRVDLFHQATCLQFLLLDRLDGRVPENRSRKRGIHSHLVSNTSRVSVRQKWKRGGKDDVLLLLILASLERCGNVDVAWILCCLERDAIAKRLAACSQWTEKPKLSKLTQQIWLVQQRMHFLPPPPPWPLVSELNVSVIKF